MAAPRFDTLWINANLATMTAGGEPYGAVAGGALAAKDGRIAWVGSGRDLPGPATELAAQVHDLAGCWITPGLIDCHSHVVYGGNRAREFEARLNGVSYEEISRQGGGIRATVAATRAASPEDLFDGASGRLAALMAEGVTTVEIKSGYGLDLETEAKMLRVARTLGDRLPLGVQTTYLGAHAVPPEFDADADGYIDFVVETALPAVAAEGLADAVDAFCEGIGFSPAQTRRVFDAARALDLPVKLHAEQLSDLGGAVLAAEYGALSCDHLEYVGEDGVAAMAAAGCVAVLLPGAFYFLRESQKPPVESFRRHDVPIAIATDCNPGSSPTVSLLLMLNMACTLFGLTPEEALAGVTRHAARALGLADDRGTLAVGKRADLAIWDIESPADLAYGIGANPIHATIFAGAARV